jgi:uncharacterized protein YcbK (DUF882 family)
MKLTKNFNLSEFASKDGSEFPKDVKDNLQELANNLQVLRYALGQPIIITSGYRSESHNKKIGGAKSSQHILGLAADIKVANTTPKNVAKKIEELIELKEMKQGGIGIYSSWVHYDIRGKKARW